MKRLICMVVCAMMLLSLVLSGCGSSSDTSETTNSAVDTAKTSTTEETEATTSNENTGKKEFSNKNLEVYMFEGGYGTKYMNAIIDSFKEKYPDVDIKITASPTISDIVKPMFLAGNPPDFYDALEMGQYGIEGALLPLNDVFEGKALDSDKLIKDLLPLGAYEEMCNKVGDGKPYFGFSSMGVSPVWYNNKYFTDKGISVPKTWDEFFALGEVAKADGKALYCYQGMWPGYNNSILWAAIANSAGVDAIIKIAHYEEGAWTDPKVKKAMQIFRDIADKGYLMKGTTALSHTQAQTDFLQGKAFFIPNGTWFKNEMKDAIPTDGSFEFGSMAPPVFNAGDQRYISGGCGGCLVIPKDGKNPELAKEFLRYQYTQKAIKYKAQIEGSIAPMLGAVELAKPYIDSSIYDANKVIDEGVQMVNYYANVLPLAPGETINYLNEIQDPMTAVFNKQMTIDEWAAKIEAATAKIRANLAKAKK